MAPPIPGQKGLIMTDLNYTSEAGGQADAAATAGKSANLVYILYLLSFVVGITSLIGLVMAYLNRNDAPEWVQSHYTLQIRTFWIGLFIGAVGVISTVIVIGWLILFSLAIWWIVRCVKGMSYIGQKMAYPHADTWLF